MAIAEIAYTAEQIRARIAELAEELRTDLQGDRPLLISVLKGSVIFLADLIRHLDLEPEVDFMSISSYGGGRSDTGVARIVKDLEEPLAGRNVVLVEDIVDTGLSLSYLVRTLHTRGPATLKVCTLIDKSVRRIVDVQVDYRGFTSEKFLIGYGLDFQGHYRNLPYLMAVNDVATLAARPQVLLQELPHSAHSGSS
ncbi:MAG: hypoxanthine phosphoribosyltransferase [Actinomycetota bacterium]